jgi:hypothetical protein
MTSSAARSRWQQSWISFLSMTSAAASMVAILDFSVDFLTNASIDWSSVLSTNYEFASLRHP